jgi:3-phenylpropionate/trans-cinnamate dioxygenase ferredoxin subunit
MPFQSVAKSSEIAEGTAKVYSIQGARVAICNLGGKFFAIDDICTHDNGPLGEGELVGGQIECPRHGARFDVKTGKALCLPAVKDVKPYPVEEKKGEVWINMTGAED